MYIPSTPAQTQTQRRNAKIPSLKFLHTLYKDTNITTKAHLQNAQFYIFAYSLQEQKHKTSSPKCPDLHVYTLSTNIYIYIYLLLSKCPVLHVCIPSTITQK